MPFTKVAIDKALCRIIELEENGRFHLTKEEKES